MDQVLRRTKRAAVEGGLVAHIERGTKPATAITREGIDAVVLLGDDGLPLSREDQAARYSGALAYVRDLRKKQSAGRPAAPVVDFMVAGLPRFADLAAWQQWIPEVDEMKRPERHRAQLAVAERYFGQVVRWLEDRGGPGSRIVTAAIHADELSPHLHTLMIVADERGRFGWNKIAARFAGPEQPRIKDRRHLSAVQDRFHADVAGPFGLGRGSTTSSGAGAQIDRAMGAAARLAEEEHEAKRALVELEERQGLEAEVAQLKAKQEVWMSAAAGVHAQPEPLGDYSVPLSPGRLATLVADGKYRGWPNSVATERDELRTDLQHVRAEVAQLKAKQEVWMSAAAGVHAQPEPLGDYSVPLSPGRLATLVATGKQHGWPTELSERLKETNGWGLDLAAELDKVKDRLKSVSAERDSVRQATAAAGTVAQLTEALAGERGGRAADATRIDELEAGRKADAAAAAVTLQAERGGRAQDARTIDELKAGRKADAAAAAVTLQAERGGRAQDARTIDELKAGRKADAAAAAVTLQAERGGRESDDQAATRQRAAWLTWAKTAARTIAAATRQSAAWMTWAKTAARTIADGGARVAELTAALDKERDGRAKDGRDAARCFDEWEAWGKKADEQIKALRADVAGLDKKNKLMYDMHLEGAAGIMSKRPVPNAASGPSGPSLGHDVSRR